MNFRDLDLLRPLQRAVRELGYKTPTPIQEQAIPAVLSGRDIMGCAQTGTGKTAAFALPILQNIDDLLYETKSGSKKPVIRSLVLAPTRELALQIHKSFEDYAQHLKIYSTVVYGGVSQTQQVRELKQGVDILVATPGRLLDLHQQGFVDLRDVAFLVLDEADRMLDMGFMPDVRRILRLLPEERQNLMFSATMPVEVNRLAKTILRDPLRIDIEPEVATPDLIEQSVYFVEKSNKRALLNHLLEDDSLEMGSVLIFTRTKRRADRIARQLKQDRFQADALHGDKSQGARQKTLQLFKKGKTKILVATDIAARGLDVDGLSHVINFDLPDEAENYVHRIGRTGRAKATGAALSFCGIEERTMLFDIQKLLQMEIPQVENHPFPSPLPHSSKPQNNRLGRRKVSRRTWSAGPSRRAGSVGKPRLRRG